MRYGFLLLLPLIGWPAAFGQPPKTAPDQVKWGRKLESPPLEIAVKWYPHTIWGVAVAPDGKSLGLVTHQGACLATFPAAS